MVGECVCVFWGYNYSVPTKGGGDQVGGIAPRRLTEGYTLIVVVVASGIL